MYDYGDYLALGTDQIYIASPYVVYAIPVDGGSVKSAYDVRVRASGQQIYGIAVDAQAIYVVQDADVVDVPIGGGEPTSLTKGSGGRHVAVDATGVYWGTTGTTAGHDGVVMKLAKGAPSAFPLSTGRTYVGSLSTDDTLLFGCDIVDGGSVFSVPKGGGATSLLFTGTPNEGPILVRDRGSEIFFTKSAAGSGEIVRMPKTGGTPTKVASVVGAWGLVVEDDAIYWGSGFTTKQGEIWRLTNGQTQPFLLARDIDTPRTVLMGDKTSIYWVDAGGLKRVAR
jgi:hypothetical protein